MIIFIQEHYASELLSKEDSIIKNIGATLFFIAAVIFGILYFKVANMQNMSAVYHVDRFTYIFFSLLFFVAAGEEISWGQRLFGWETPAVLKEINLQDEINAHNIILIHGNTERIFNLFCLIYGVLLPIIISQSNYMRKLYEKFNIVVPPLWVSGLIVLNLGLSSVLFRSSYFENWTQQSIGELRETLIAFIFFVFALHQILFFKKCYK